MPSVRELYETLEADWRARDLTEAEMLALDKQYAGCCFVKDGKRVPPHGIGPAPIDMLTCGIDGEHSAIVLPS